MEIDDGSPEFIESMELPGIFSEQFVRGEDMPYREVTTKKILWQIRRITRPYFKGHETYMVRVDDEGIFNDLEKIKEADFLNVVEREMKETRRYWRHNFNQAILRAGGEFKRLPWWKRLFNDFSLRDLFPENYIEEVN